MSVAAGLREVAPGVFVAHVPQWCTASTVIADGGTGHDREALVVDPAMTAGEIDELAAEISGLGFVVTGGVVTHPHVDHVLWRPSLGSAPRWAAPRAFARIRDDPE